MALRNYQWIGQMFAALGVIASLVLVAYELKQSRDVAKAELTLQVTRSDVAPILSSYDADATSRAWLKLDRGEEPSESEMRNWRREAILSWSTLRDRHMLWGMGLLSDGELSSAMADVEMTWMGYEEYRELFKPEVWLVPDSFRAYVIAARAEWAAAIEAGD